MLTCTQTACLIQEWDEILILCHASPDGDTLGSGCALLRGLQALGKRARIGCADPLPQKYGYMLEGLPSFEGEPRHILSVDVADAVLLGDFQEIYGRRVELAIDHHGTHEDFAAQKWVNSSCASTTEMIYLLLKELGVVLDTYMADAIYTGLSTDTGCFRYRSVTPQTHRIAAEVIEAGADAGEINRRMFETKSIRQVEAERQVRDTMEFFCEGKCAMVQVPLSILKETGVEESELDGVATMPRQIEGVLMGITLKEKPGGEIKASVRTNLSANAADFCRRFGGGGHQGAAGCSFKDATLVEAAEKIKQACGLYLQEIKA